VQGDRDGYNVSQLQLLGTRSSIAAEETLFVLRCAPAGGYLFVRLVRGGFHCPLWVA